MIHCTPPPTCVQDHPAVIEGLDLVEEDDQITHLLSLTDEFDGLVELSQYTSFVFCYTLLISAEDLLRVTFLPCRCVPP